MKILFVSDNSIGVRFMRKALSTITPDELEITSIKLGEYMGTNDSGFDGLIYNTFPDEQHSFKFRKDVIDQTDNKFHAFKGTKLLLDSHDDGFKDAFSRFDNTQLPRVKVVPSQNAFGCLSIITSIPFAISDSLINRVEEKTLPLIYCATINGYKTDIRKRILDILTPFKPLTSRLPYAEYERALASARISVIGPGWGDACIGHIEALAANTLLLAHESVAKIKLFPFVTLTEDRDYVLFNLDTLADKLRDMLDNPDKAARIAKNGNKVFKRGYNPRKVGEIITKFFTRGIIA